MNRWMLKMSMAVAVWGASLAWAGAVEMQSVTSSWLDKAGYDAETKTFYLQMQNSSDVYAYDGVPAKVYQEFLDAPSKGDYYVQHIKAVYPATRQ